MVHKSKKGKNQYETKVNGIYAVMSYIKHNTHVLIRMPKEWQEKKQVNLIWVWLPWYKIIKYTWKVHLGGRGTQ